MATSPNSMGQTHLRQTDDADSVAIRIVEEVAERERVEPVDLTPPLHEAIDPDCLETLFVDPVSGGKREGIHVTFTYCGYEITVEDDGEIAIRPA